MFNDAIKKFRFARSFVMRRMVHVNLQLLYRCNFRCDICDFWKEEYRDKPALTAAQVAILSRKLASIGPQVVSLGGGEPLLHPAIDEIVGILGKDHFPVMICNGWHVTPERARALFAAGIYEVSISLDYADPAKHDRQRGMPGAHERAVQALATLAANRTAPHQRVHMISVVMDDNLDDIEPLILLSRKLGITYLVTLYSDSRGRKEWRSPDQEVSARLLSLKKKYPEFVALRGYLARFTESVANRGIFPCYAGKNLLNIDSGGNVTFCIDRLENPAGNILADDMEAIMARLAEQRRSNECRGCWTSCRGSIESVMYGGGRWGNLRDYYGMTRDVPLSSAPRS